jgi:hypothetical protein
MELPRSATAKVWLLAKPIARQQKHAFAPIPQGEREHPIHSLEGGLDPSVFEGRQHDLGIGVAPESYLGLPTLQLLAEPFTVVNLSVVDDHESPAGGKRSTMLQRIGQAAREGFHVRLLAPVLLDKSSQATHLEDFSQASSPKIKSRLSISSLVSRGG